MALPVRPSGNGEGAPAGSPSSGPSCTPIGEQSRDPDVALVRTRTVRHRRGVIVDLPRNAPVLTPMAARVLTRVLLKARGRDQVAVHDDGGATGLSSESR